MRIFKSEIPGFYLAESLYEERLLLGRAGWIWDRELFPKQWSTDKPEVAARLIEYADEEVKGELADIAEKREKSINGSKATSSNIEVPAPAGKGYFPFQRAGIEFIVNHENTLLADDMGLGKSIQAIGVINLLDEINRVLLICPASLKINWRKELAAWLTRVMSIEIASSKKPFPDANIVIVNFDILHKFEAELRSEEWDLLIVDESHFLKGNSRRSHHVVGKRKKYARSEAYDIEPIKAKRSLFMSGTPIENRPAELWNMVHYLAPDTFKNYTYFTRRYCDAKRGRWGWQVSGAQHLDELQTALRETIMIRRLKTEVLTELPAKLRQIIELPQNGARKVVEAENKAYSEHEELLSDLKVAAELAKASEDKTDYNDAVEKLKASVGLAFNELAKARQETAIAKVPYVLGHLENVSGKVCVFAHHREVIKQLKEELGDKAVILMGGMSDKAKNEAVERFQTDPNVQFFIGSIMAAGVGLTLTASNHAVFAELDWKPSTMNQCEDRLHRISQVNSVLIQHLVFDGSLDANMAKTVVAKQAIIDQALGDDLNFPVILPDEEEPVTHGIGFNQIAEEAKNILPETVEAIHLALRYLATLCDGARAVDGKGFNKFDAEIGRNLAKQATLSQKQAALGRKILRKYKGQLGDDVMESISD